LIKYRVVYKIIKSIRIWDVESGGCIQISNGHTDDVLSILKYSDECFLNGSFDRKIK
jgi:WD40 repeat protein